MHLEILELWGWFSAAGMREGLLPCQRKRPGGIYLREQNLWTRLIETTPQVSDGCLRSILSRPDIVTRMAQSIKWLGYGLHVRENFSAGQDMFINSIQTGPGDSQSLRWATGSFFGYKLTGTVDSPLTSTSYQGQGCMELCLHSFLNLQASQPKYSHWIWILFYYCITGIFTVGHCFVSVRCETGVCSTFQTNLLPLS